jgi:hypothetical protein
MISLFSIFGVMELQGDFMQEPYNPGEYKFKWILVVTFPALHNNFIYIKHAYFASLMKYILNCCELFFAKMYVD